MAPVAAADAVHVVAADQAAALAAAAILTNAGGLAADIGQLHPIERIPERFVGKTVGKIPKSPVNPS